MEKHPDMAKWDEPTEKLAVFIFGVASHQIADVVWHGGLTGVPEGFISSMGFADFHAKPESAHPIADQGGDVCHN